MARKPPRVPKDIDCPICLRSFHWEPSPRGGVEPRFCGDQCKLVEDSLKRLETALIAVEPNLSKAAATALKRDLFKLSGSIQTAASGARR